MNKKYLSTKLFFRILTFITIAFTYACSSADDGLSPVNRYKAGLTLTGAYNVMDTNYCSQKARKQYLPNIISGNTVLTRTSDGKAVTVEQSLALNNTILNQVFNVLASYGDPVINNRHICTGYYMDPLPGGNALSYGRGYIIFDFRLFQRLNELPNEQRGMYLYDYVIYHEFAHQLQYWTLDPEIIKKLQGLQSSEKSELAADCVAGALIRLVNLRTPDELFNISFRGATGAAIEVGSYNFHSPDFHGTPLNRSIATNYGANMIANLRADILGENGLLYKPNAVELLKRCNNFVNKNLGKAAPVLPQN